LRRVHHSLSQSPWRFRGRAMLNRN
jgi:hypothetical protein